MMKIFANGTFRKLAVAFACLALVGAKAFAANNERANEPTVVVYPASATSKIPTVIGARGLTAPPVPEEFERDVDTPIGQVRAVLGALDELRRLRRADSDALDELRAAAKELTALLRDAADAPAPRDDEILDAIAELRVRFDSFLESNGDPMPAPVATPGVATTRDPFNPRERWTFVVLTLAIAVVAWRLGVAKAQERFNRRRPTVAED